MTNLTQYLLNPIICNFSHIILKLLKLQIHLQIILIEIVKINSCCNFTSNIKIKTQKVPETFDASTQVKIEITSFKHIH